MMTADSLRARTCKDLAAMARKQGVDGWSAMRKDQLIRALLRRSRKAGAAATRASRSTLASVRSGSSLVQRSTQAADASAASAAVATHVLNSKNGAAKNGSAQNGAAQNGASAPRMVAGAGRKPPHQVRQWSKDLASDSPAHRTRSKDRLVVMVRDSYWLHACWELRRQSIERATAAMAHQWHTARPVLRLLEVVNDGTTNSAERVLRDVEIHGGVNNWYLHVDNPPLTYRVAIGYRGEGDTFYCLARSNVVTTPSPDASDDLDRNWDDVARNFDKIYAMSGGYQEESSHGELQELFEERLRRPMGSPISTRFGMAAEGLPRHGGRFHFEVEAEMLVYGVANPDGHVTLRGEPVQLRADGSFTVRLAMPDRRQVIPIVANSADGLEQRTIVLAVERNKKVMETLVREPEEPGA
ncbi:MAG: DUF4912 domain-containing protein [Planctomycetia bacterium]|nr:DUF4912 domain-containing protein [Planctomycetia bacterium]